MMKVALVVAALVVCVAVQVHSQGTKCQDERERIYSEIDVNNLADVQAPECDQEGNYARKQCPHHAYCVCVKRKSGKPRFKDVEIPRGDSYDCKKKPTECQVAKWKMMLDSKLRNIPPDFSKMPAGC